MTRINYTLAKELKDAGFPQKGTGDTLIYKSQNVGLSTSIHDKSVYQPTLSELIEAFGTGFEGLRYSSGIHSDRREGTLKWWASAYYHGDIFEEDGKTPEEAVARLWLALNK